MKWIALSLNCLGLLLGIGGTYLVWRYGLPAAEITETEDFKLMTEGYDQAKSAAARDVVKRQSKRGLGALMVSFTLQLLGSIAGALV